MRLYSFSFQIVAIFSVGLLLGVVSYCSTVMDFHWYGKYLYLFL